MAKRGERRPYRVRFAWASGIKGADTFADLEEARRFITQLRVRRDGWHTRGHHDVEVTWTLEDARERPAVIIEQGATATTTGATA